MIKNRVKETISRGELAIGTYVSLADPAVVEIIGLAGYDAAFIDMEHTAFEIPKSICVAFSIIFSKVWKNWAAVAPVRTRWS